jgi:hypothetical protein
LEAISPRHVVFSLEGQVGRGATGFPICRGEINFTGRTAHDAEKPLGSEQERSWFLKVFVSFAEGINRGQVSLLPVCVDDYVASEALVRVVGAFVASPRAHRHGGFRHSLSRNAR